jgi:formamidopyrimidine-DNA glycosylase
MCSIYTISTNPSLVGKYFAQEIKGKERDFLQVQRPKQKYTLSGEPILTAEIDKRKTYYTGTQKLFE